MTPSNLAMSWSEWAKHDAVALADLIRKGELTAREAAAQAAAATERLNPRLEAVLEIFEDVVANPDADGPSRDGRLYGVPFFLKDLGSGLKGRKREAGSKLLLGSVVAETDPFVGNVLAAGLVPLGRATTPELGQTFDTSTDYLGRPFVTRNPWHLGRTAGGSSGGGAAVVAAGITPIAMSSDGGGSTRLPAGFCGLVGLKVTRGLVPPALGRSQMLSRYGVEGVMTRTVRDSAAALDYITRIPNGGTFIPVRPFPGSYLASAYQAPDKLRVALSTGPWGFDTPPDPEQVARTRELARVLEQLGHAVEEIADDSAICDFGLMRRTFRVGWQSGSAQTYLDCQARGLDPRRTLSPMVAAQAERAMTYDRWAIQQTYIDNITLTRQFGRFFEQYDLLVAPQCAIRPPEANGPCSLLHAGDYDAWFERLHAAVRYTSPANETGLPAIALPAGPGSDGVPISVQLYGSFLAEDLLLRVAAQLEQAKPDWFNQTPPVHVMRDA